jgi:hypothetical protein
MTNGVEAFSVFGGESRPIKLTLGFGFFVSLTPLPSWWNIEFAVALRAAT